MRVLQSKQRQRNDQPMTSPKIHAHNMRRRGEQLSPLALFSLLISLRRVLRLVSTSYL